MTVEKKRIRKINFFFEILPLILQYKLNYVFDFLFSLENKLISKHLENIKVDDQVYVCGYARSGTTSILNLINSTNLFGSLKYRSLPFVNLPVIWNKVSKKIYSSKDIFRYHGDGITINSESPDAFEEIFWKNYIISYYLNYYKKDISKYIDARFIDKYKIFIKKILFIEKKSSYLSKNNNNLFRLNYIHEKFPFAKFVVCIRNPIEHCYSLLRVHSLFLQYSSENDNFAKFLKNLCHFEFGYTRKVIEIGDYKSTVERWKKKEEFNGYLNQWINIHAYLLDSLKKINKKNFIIIDNTYAIDYPSETIIKLANFLNISPNLFDQDLLKKNNNHYNNLVNSDLSLKAEKIYKMLINL